MKVLLFAPFAHSGGHHETDLEFAIRHLHLGNDVHVIQCHRELSTCDPNPKHEFLKCLLCSSTSENSFSRTGVHPQNIYSLNIKEPIDLGKGFSFKDIDELKSYRWKGAPAGLAVASTLITLDCDSHPDVKKHAAYIEKSLRMFASVYDTLEQRIQLLKPDLFYVFNGRTVILNAAFCAARTLGVKTVVAEREHFKSFIQIENATGVDIQFAQKSILEFKQRMALDPESEAIGSSWYFSNRDGNKEQLCNYLRVQTQGSLPVGFDKTKHNVAIFTSSEWEVAAAPGWQMALFADQTEGIQYILANVQDTHVHFYLRIHPNLWNKDNRQMRELSVLKAPNLTVLSPDSPVDSYALLEACDNTVTFGSTIGIETTFWNKPSILLGRCFWEHLGATYNPKTKEEAIRLICKKLSPLGRDKATPYGYWWRKRGEPFQYVQPFNPVTNTSAKLNGVPLGPSPLDRFILLWAERVVRWTRRGFNLIRRVLNPI